MHLPEARLRLVQYHFVASSIWQQQCSNRLYITLCDESRENPRIIEFDASLISSILELTHLQILD